MREGKEGCSEEDVFHLPTPEEEAEASFYFFIQDVQTYSKAGKWGPRIWQSLDEETKEIWRNMTRLESLGYQTKDFSKEPYDTRT